MGEWIPLTPQSHTGCVPCNCTHVTMDTRDSQKPLLFLDVDGVISLFGFREGYGLAPGNAPFADCPPGRLHSINGVMHYISAACGSHLRRISEHYELVWATGWEETANDYLPHLLE